MQRMRRYRWPLIALGLHTALICFAHIEGKHSPLVWAYPICVDFPVSLLILQTLGGFLKQLAIDTSTREFILGGVLAIVGGAQWFAIIAIIGSRFRRVLNQDGVSNCMRCGYNLTGNTSGVCPECGEKT